ncbi:hypothetical protein F5X68DRAFT_187502 [Plectosphaerella plurivora]|uniref:DUF7888 domain-containing protein n=1 Tax=Plectosphaerella plurivora TaxID=936078 RepID=A0A9P8VL00_9PEZI|nr:hypothetical protein F5X68DRAFT_187502 [Plectosphaerella plurivora]
MRFTTATIVQAIVYFSVVDALALPMDGAVGIEGRSADDASVQEISTIHERADLPPSTGVVMMGVKENGHFTEKEDPAGMETAVAVTKRASPLVVAIAGPAINIFATVTAAAIKAAVAGLVSMAFWNPARENFTRNTVRNMWNQNPDAGRYGAAICYNKGYRLQRPAGINGLRSAKLRMGAFNTDYDCMFMEYGNQFYTNSEGGYITDSAFS